MKPLLISLILFCSCSNSKVGHSTIPACIQQQLSSFQNDPNAPVKVEEYNYKGQTVYLFTAACCDKYNTVYDKNCQELCAPSGGLDGKGDRRCTDFTSLAQKVRVIWSK